MPVQQEPQTKQCSTQGQADERVGGGGLAQLSAAWSEVRERQSGQEGKREQQRPQDSALWFRSAHDRTGSTGPGFRRSIIPSAP